MDTSSESDDNIDFDHTAVLQHRRERIFNDRIFITDPTMFRERFRLTHRLFEILLRQLAPELAQSTHRSHALSAKDKLLIGLRYYATNQEYYNSGDTQGNL